MASIFISIIYFIVGFAGAYILNEISLRKNKGLYSLIQAVKKKGTFAILETDKSAYVRTISNSFKNLAVTPEKEIIIMTKSSPKPIVNMGGVQVIHGDLYKSVSVPQEVRKFITDMEAKNWRPEDIAKFMEEIEQTPAEFLTQTYKSLYQSENYPGTETRISMTDKQKYNIYLGMSSVVKDFIYTGLNRTTIHSMMRELVYQRELEKGTQRNWIMIAIAVMIILIALGFAIRWITGGAGISSLLGSVGPLKINPGG